MSNEGAPVPKSTNLPLLTLGAGVILISLAIIGLIFVPTGHDAELFTIIGLIVTTVPSLIASFHAERIGKDIRNGVLTQKVTEGTTKALEDTGVTQVVEASGRGEGTIAAIRALTALLEHTTVIKADPVRPTIVTPPETPPDVVP